MAGHKGTLLKMAEIRFWKRKVKHGGSPELKENRQRVSVPQLKGDSQGQFMGHLNPQRKPLVLKGIDLGACTSKWTVDYLSQIGGRKEVKIHVAAVAQMDFISKNFVYRYFLLRFTLGIYVTFFKPVKYFCIIIQRPYGIFSLGLFDIIIE